MIHTSNFRPAHWLRNHHLQTLWPALVRRRPRVTLTRERLRLDDGDHLELAWGPDAGGPLVVILHGLGGSADSGYVRGLVRTLRTRELGAVVMQFRGAGGRPNSADRFYHAGEYRDLEETLATLRRRFPGRPLAVVGFSLGGSVLLNYLGALGDGAGIDAACAVSVPFELAACADALERGFARLYQWDLLRGLKRLVAAKFAGRADAPVELARIRRLRTLRGFDDAVTAPLHGFAGVDDYYRRCSCRQRLNGITTTTLIIQAGDDPFVPGTSLPAAEELAPAVTLELSRHGGHVGFVAPGPRRYWLEGRIADFLQQQLRRR